jgi:hypothetical protein
VLENATQCPEADNFKKNVLLPKYGLAGAKIEEYGFFVKNKAKTVAAVLKACQIEYIIDNTKSPWCKLVGDDIFKAFEIFEDITYHCKFGYKYKITKMMTCDLLKDLVFRLNEVKNRY